MLSPDSKEEDLLLFLTGVKKEDRLTWEKFGNGDWDEIKDVCQKKWGLDSFQITKIKTIHTNHPAKRKAPQQTGK